MWKRGLRSSPTDSGEFEALDRWGLSESSVPGCTEPARRKDEGSGCPLGESLTFRFAGTGRGDAPFILDVAGADGESSYSMLLECLLLAKSASVDTLDLTVALAAIRVKEAEYNTPLTLL